MINPSPFIANDDKYLLAVLNSTVGDYYIRSLGVTRNGGYFEYKPMFVLTPITDGMSDEEKLAVIQKEFDRLYDPRHPVRNIIETLDSVEVVRTIREALKR